MDNISNNNRPGWQPSGAGNNYNSSDNRPKPPPPPPPEINLRTMNSDIQSMKETGGSNPIPKSFTPPEIIKPQAPIAPKYTPPSSMPAAPKPTFVPPPTNFSSVPKTVSPAQFATSEELNKPSDVKVLSESESESGKPKAAKRIALLGSVIVVGVIFALLGYYVIFPKLYPPQTPAPVTYQPQEQTPAQTETPQPETTTPEARTPFTHSSLLKVTDASADVTLPAISLSAITNALLQEADKVASPGALVEVAFKDAISAVPAGAFLSALLPDVASQITSYIEQDFTTALYYDAKGAWPVFVLKAKANTSAQQGVITAAIESSTNLKNLYVSDPGTAGTFKTGQVGGNASRYLSYSNPGASLNLIWKNNSFIISSSYDAAKRVVATVK